ncbi:MAG: hypothetical protein R3F61_17810 [Myxococcota bacterium]
MNRHVLIAGIVAAAGLLGLWVLSPGGDAPVAEAAVQTPDSPGPRITRFEAPDGVGGSEVPEPKAPVPAAQEPADPAWPALHGKFRRVMGSHLEVVVPEDATDAEAQELRMDAVDVRSEELDDLIVELTELAETTPDRATKIDALVSLGEVYLELASTIGSTPVPDWMKPRRAERMQADLDQREAVALDQARMVLGMAQSTGGDAMGTEMAQRIRAGLAAAE